MQNTADYQIIQNYQAAKTSTAQDLFMKKHQIRPIPFIFVWDLIVITNMIPIIKNGIISRIKQKYKR